MVPTLEQGRDWLGLGSDETLDDSRITLLLQASVGAFETYTSTALLVRTFTQQFEGGEELWLLDKKPVSVITTILDPKGNSLPSSQYLLHKGLGMIEWYSIAPRAVNADDTRGLWTVTYTAGHFSSEALVPTDVRTGLLGMMAKWYFNPQPGVQSTREGDSATAYIPNPSSKAVIPPEIEALWCEYRRRNV